jgi:LacI family transcriptional regulator
MAWLGAGDDLADFVSQAQKPTVDFSFRRPELKFTRVLENTTQTARLVVDHFLSRGFRHFLFYSDVHNWVYDERGNAFLAHLKLAGRTATWLRWHESSKFCSDHKAWIRKCAWLAHEMKRVPKPVGVFAASDGLALEVLETCKAAGITVPEEVSIVGAGNSLLGVDAMRTPISSVDVNFEMVGYQGAAMLDQLMQRKPAPQYPVRVSPFRLIVRKSSDLIAVKHPGVAKSLRFMWDHYHEPITVDDLATAASMSLRNYYHVFVDNVGRPPGSEMQRIRIERAKRLLLESNDKIKVISQMCGYTNANSFWVAFKRSVGMPPTAYSKFQQQKNLAAA